MSDGSFPFSCTGACITLKNAAERRGRGARAEDKARELRVYALFYVAGLLYLMVPDTSDAIEGVKSTA